MKRTSLFTRREFMKQMAFGIGGILPLSTIGFHSDKLATNNLITIHRLLNDKNIKGLRTKVFGIGKSGINAVFRLFNETDYIDDTIEFILVDTVDSASLRLTPTLSAEQVEEIKNIVRDNQLTIIMAELGQDTISDVVPTIAGLSKEMKNFTITVASEPTNIENYENNLLRARQRFELWRLYGDCIIKVPGFSSQINKKMSPLHSPQSADMIMAGAVSGLYQLLFFEQKTGMDFADIKWLPKDVKDLSFGIGWGSGKNRVHTATTAAINMLHSTRNSSDLSRGAYFLLVAKDDASFTEIEEGANIMFSIIPPELETKATWGIIVNNRLDEEIMQAIIYGC